MKPICTVVTALLAMMATSACWAAPTIATPATRDVGANMATLVLQSGGTGTGYFTLLYGSNGSCGAGTQVKAGQTDTGEAAPYSGSLLLNAATDGYYAVRNLARSTDYTICFTAESPSGSTPNPTPVAANLTTTGATAFSSAYWTEAGDPGFSAADASFTSLAFAPDGTPYLAYVDGAAGYKATVMKFADNAWSGVGTGGFSTGEAEAVSLAFAPDGTPHVAYEDWSNGARATVMKYSGAAWSPVGSAGFSAGTASFTSLAFAPDGAPYVAYGDDENDGKATVMKYSADAWGVVGSGGFSDGAATFTSLAFAPDGTPYVAYGDGARSGKATVMKYDNDAWSPVGIAGFSDGTANSISLAIASDGTPHVAYSDYGNSGRATVMKYSGGAWSPVGSAGLSVWDVDFTSLAIAPDGIPHVAYTDYGNTGKTTVMKYGGTDWSVVGSAGFSDGAARNTSLSFALNGTPYIAYGDDGNSGKTTVMKLTNPPINLPTISGTPAAAATVGTPYSFTPTATDAASFSVAGTLPPGLSFSSHTGTLSGTPTAVGAYSNIVITATNGLGSASLPQFSITVSDAALPDTTITTFPANPASSASFTFAFTSTQAGSTFECSLGGGGYATCASPYSGSIVYAPCTTCRVDSLMSFAVRAKSQAGSTDPTPATYAWTINHPIGTVFDNVLDGGTVQLPAGDLAGSLNLSRGVAYAVRGGYDSGYATNPGVTNIRGTVAISGGTVTFEKIVIM